MRLLILIFLAFLLYRVVRKYVRAGQNPEQRTENGSVDEMVQDPSCMTYIPKRTAYRKVISGREHFFCGKECAEKFEREKVGV